MDQRDSNTNQSTTLGKSGLYLSIAAVAFVFGLGLCAIVGIQQGTLIGGGTVLFVCGASSAFLGVIGAILGGASLISGENPRGVGITGLFLGILGVCLFFFVLSAIGG